MGIQTFHGRTVVSVDIWVYDIARSALSRVTLEGVNITPLWTPDGKRFIYASGATPLTANLVSGPADGTTPPSLLINDGVFRIPQSISADGKLVVGHLNSIAASGNDSWALCLTDGATAARSRSRPWGIDSVSRERIDYAGWISKIGPSRRLVANKEQSVWLVCQDVMRKSHHTHSLIPKVRTGLR